MAFKFGGVSSTMSAKDITSSKNKINSVIKDCSGGPGNYFIYLLDSKPNVLQEKELIKEIEKYTHNYVVIVAVDSIWKKDDLKGGKITDFFIKHKSEWRDYLTKNGHHVDGIMTFGPALYGVNYSADILPDDFIADKWVPSYYYRGHELFPVDSFVYPVHSISELYPKVEKSASNVNWKTRFFYAQNKRMTHPEERDWEPDMSDPVFHTVKTLEEANQVFKDNMNANLVAFDTETSGLRFYKDSIRCLTICWNGVDGYYIPWDLVNHRLFFANAMSCKHRTGANPKFDLKFFYDKGISRQLNVTDATDMAAHAIHSERSVGLKPNSFFFTHMGGYDFSLDLWKKQTGCNDYTKIPEDVLSRYATMDAIATWRLQVELWNLMDKNDKNIPNSKFPDWPIRRWYEEQMMTIYGDIVQTEYDGIFVNWDLMNEHRDIMLKDCEKRTKALREKWNVDDKVNLLSTTEAGKLFERLGWPDHGKSKNGCFATNDDAMTMWIREGMDGAKDLQELRQEFSAMNSFIGTPDDPHNPDKGGTGWLGFIKNHPEDGSHRIHQSYKVMGTTSFRFIGKDPNFQNIPTHSQFAHYVKECIDTPPDDLYVITSDSGKEYRLGSFERLLTQRGYIRADEIEETDTIIENSEKPTVLRIEIARQEGGKYHTPEAWWFNKTNDELKENSPSSYETIYTKK